MNRTCLAAALSALMLTAASPLTAQNLELPQYTAEQRWQRLGYEMAGWQAAMVALGESQGMTAEEVGAWVGDFFSSSWLSGAEASQLTVGMNRNFMAMPDATVEVLETTPTSVKARFNHPIDPYLGPGGRIMGVDGDDIATMLRAVDDAIAEWTSTGRWRRATTSSRWRPDTDPSRPPTTFAGSVARICPGSRRCS
jgi:hypothetical protein